MGIRPRTPTRPDVPGYPHMNILLFASRFFLGSLITACLFLQGCTAFSLSPKQVAPPATIVAADGAEAVRLETSDHVLLAGSWWVPAQQPPRAVILLAHGTIVHAGFYAPMANYFTDQGIAVFGIDFRGWGQSGGFARNGTLTNYDDYLTDLRTAYQEVKSRYPDVPLFLQGESMGGTIALLSQAEADDFDVDGLVLNAPAVRPGLSFGPVHFPHFLNNFGLWAMAQPGKAFPNMPLLYPPRLIEKTMIGTLLKEKENQRRFIEDPYATHTALPLSYFTALQDATSRVEDQLGKVTAPVIIVQGDRDILVPPSSSRYTLEKIGSEDKTLKMYRKITHATLHDRRREEIWDEILSWIDARLPAADSQDNVANTAVGF